MSARKFEGGAFDAQAAGIGGGFMMSPTSSIGIGGGLLSPPPSLGVITHFPAHSAWDVQEQRELDRYLRHEKDATTTSSLLQRSINAAAKLPRKSVREVAMRIQLMQEEEEDKLKKTTTPPGVLPNEIDAKLDRLDALLRELQQPPPRTATAATTTTTTTMELAVQEFISTAQAGLTGLDALNARIPTSLILLPEVMMPSSSTPAPPAAAPAAGDATT